MQNKYHGDDHNVIICVGDSVSEQALSHYEDLIKATKMQARFVHACEQESGSVSFMAHAYVGTNSWHLTRSLQRQKEESHKILLESNLRTFPAELHANKKVVTGAVTDAIISEAKSNNSSFIICSPQHSNYKNWFKGLSTSLQLMSESETPVLAIPEQWNRKIFTKKINILVADDLHDTPASLFPEIREFGKSLGGATYYHLHVSKEEQDLKNYLERLKSAMNLAQIPFNPDISDDKCLKKFEEFIRFKMKSRSGSPLEVCDGRNFRWESAIRSGDPQTEIEKFCAEYGIDLVVFGRHLTIHTKPFELGKLPCKTMLNLKIPVMIFPPKPEDKELDQACFPVGL